MGSLRNSGALYLCVSTLTLFHAVTSLNGEPRPSTIPDPVRNTVPQLMAGLKSPHARLRRYVAFLLGEKGPAGGPAAASLMKTLTDRDPSTRSLAREALVKLWPHVNADARSAVTAMLRNKDSNTRLRTMRLVQALGSSGVAYRGELMRLARGGDELDRIKAIEVLCTLATTPEHVRPLLPALRNPDEVVSGNAARSIARLPRSLLKPFIPELRSGPAQGSVAYRRAVLNMLLEKKMDAAPFATGLIRALDSPDAVTRRLALFALKKLPDVARANADKIESILKQDPGELQRAAALSLLHTAGIVKYKRVLQALGNSNQQVRFTAMLVLRKISLSKTSRSPSALEYLPLLRSRYPDTVQFALRKLKSEEYAKSIHDRQFVRRLLGAVEENNCAPVQLLETMVLRESRVIQEVAAVLTDNLRNDICIRYSTRAAARLGPAATKMFRENFSRDRRVHRAVREGLLLSDAHALTLLTEFSRDPRPAVRREAANIIFLKTHFRGGRRPPRRSSFMKILPELLQALDDSDAMVRLITTRTLTRLRTNRPRRIAVLRRLLTHEDHRIRGRALTAAGEMGAEAKPLLELIWKAVQDKKTIRRALGALERMGPAAQSVLPRLLKRVQEEKNSAVLSHIASILPALDPPGRRVLPALIELARTKAFGPGGAAVQALQELDAHSNEVIELYIHLANRSHPALRYRGLRGLGALGPAAATPKALQVLQRVFKKYTGDPDRELVMRALLRLHERGSPSARINAMALETTLGERAESGNFALRLLLRNGKNTNRAVLFMSLLNSDGSRDFLAVARRLGLLARDDKKLRTKIKGFVRGSNTVRNLTAAVALNAAGDTRFAESIPVRERDRARQAGKPFKFIALETNVVVLIHSPAKAGAILLARAKDNLNSRSWPAVRIRRAALRGLADLGSPSPATARAFRAWIHDTRIPERERLLMARALLEGRADSREAAAVFLTGLARDSRYHRLAAIRLLARAGVHGRSVLPELRRIAAQGDQRLRRAARRAIRDHRRTPRS